jgi:hypothetical protein
MREFHRRQPTPCGNAAPARPRLVAYSSRRKRPGGSQGEQGSRRDLVVPSTIRSTALRRSAAERLLVVTDTRPSHPLRGDLSSHLAREACSRRPSHQSGCPSCSFRNRSYRDRPTVSNVTDMSGRYVYCRHGPRPSSQSPAGPQQPGAAALVRRRLLADGVHAGVSGRCRLPGPALARSLRPRRPPRPLSALRARAQVPPDQDPRLLHLRHLRAARPPAEGHHLRAVLDLAAPLVLRDVSDG